MSNTQSELNAESVPSSLRIVLDDASSEESKVSEEKRCQEPFLAFGS